MAAGPMKLVWILGLLGIAAEKRVPSLLRASPDYAPTYDEKRVPPTPLEVLSEKTALDALKARSAAAAADGISQQIQTLTAAGHAREAALGARSVARVARKDFEATKEETTDLLRFAEEAEELAKSATHSVEIGMDAMADIPARADGLIGRRLDLKLAKPLKELTELKAKRALAGHH
ncbi:unnamed protein product [Durusdinium trenchii]|uniref:Uncharacterized protein n=1 Tax=Durusdinium trenchii TaxID=1381693 RepID=A0ABP0JA74_9DINO